jgi:HEAT repeat protein
MRSTFETFRRLGPAAFVLKAIVAALIADMLLLGFILLRRTYRKRYFAKRDARVFELRQKWDALLSGEIPFESWRRNSFEVQIIETIVLDAFEAAGSHESARLLKFMRHSGLIDKRIFEARQHHGWRRHQALVALGRTRAPEGIPALAEGLRDRDLETRLAALRGLGRIACPEAAAAILSWVAEVGLAVPALPLQTALIQSVAERPELLLPYLHHSKGELREVLGRVLGEVATPSLAADLLPFVQDELPELRAAAARALSQAEPALAVEVLSELAQDAVWFVRLRAIVSLRKLRHADTIPALLRGLTDSNRLVRLRAAEGLVDLKSEMVAVFEKVVATDDRYGLHAYFTALDHAGLQARLEAEVNTSPQISKKIRDNLIKVLRTGTLSSKQPVTSEMAAAKAASRP